MTTTTTMSPERSLVSMRRAAEIIGCSAVTLRDAVTRGELLCWPVELRSDHELLSTTRRSLRQYAAARVINLGPSYRQHREQLLAFVDAYDREFGRDDD